MPLLLEVKLAYILPYASFHESRQNWRPVMFSKFFSLVATMNSTASALRAIISPFWPKYSSFTNWTAHQWPDYPTQLRDTNYYVHWRSSTGPPVISPFEFVTYGYGSCTAWSTLLTYVARSVGIPTRQVGTPCWNLPPFKGLSTNNPNVTECWHGGNSTSVGGNYLFNHNWIEYWDDVTGDWVYMNVPPTSDPDTSLCSNFSKQFGCCSGDNLAFASKDHEIFSMTWHFPFEASPTIDGGAIIDVKGLKLTNGQSVSPLVWSPYLTNPIGQPLKDIGLRVVNRTDYYRCRDPHHFQP